jgi:hypothetical protein
MVKITTDEELMEDWNYTVFPDGPNEFQKGALFERRRMLNIIEYEINIADSLGDYLSGVYLNRWRKHFLEGHHCHWMSEYNQVMADDWMGRV